MLDAQNTKDTMDYILPWLIEAENDLLNEDKPGIVLFVYILIMLYPCNGRLVDRYS